MHIIVTGGRHYDDRNYLFGALDALHAVTPIARLAHGGARGADTLAGEWAQSRNVPEVSYPITPEQWRKSVGRLATCETPACTKAKKTLPRTAMIYTNFSLTN
jgi:hypothetical protein